MAWWTTWVERNWTIALRSLVVPCPEWFLVAVQRGYAPMWNSGHCMKISLSILAKFLFNFAPTQPTVFEGSIIATHGACIVACSSSPWWVFLGCFGLGCAFALWPPFCAPVDVTHRHGENTGRQKTTQHLSLLAQTSSP